MKPFFTSEYIDDFLKVNKYIEDLEEFSKVNISMVWKSFQK